MNAFFSQIWFLLLISTPGYVAASMLLTRYALTGSYYALSASIALYICCNLAFARIIALGDGLASAYVMSASATMISIVAAAVLIQNEQLTPAKIAGVCAALAAIALFSLPASGAK